MSLNAEAAQYRQDKERIETADRKMTRRQALKLLGGGAGVVLTFVVAPAADSKFKYGIAQAVDSKIPPPSLVEFQQANESKQELYDKVDQQIQSQTGTSTNGQVNIVFSQDDAIKHAQAQETINKHNSIARQRLVLEAQTKNSTPWGFGTEMSTLKTVTDSSLAAGTLLMLGSLGSLVAERVGRIGEEESNQEPRKVNFNPANPIQTFFKDIKTSPVGTTVSSAVNRARIIFTVPKK